MKVYLFRHGETVYTPEYRYLGVTDLPLSESGRQQLQAIHWLNPKVVYTSPMLRCRETADIFFPGVKQIPVKGLEEMNFGVFEGRNYKEMEHDEAYRKWIDSNCEDRCPGGETRSEFSERICSAFIPLVDRALAENQEELTIVAHGGTIMSILSAFSKPERDYFSGMTPAGGGHELEVDAKTWKSEKKMTWIRKIEKGGAPG